MSVSILSVDRNFCSLTVLTCLPLATDHVAKEIPDYKFVFLLLLFRLKEGERKKKKLLSRDSTKTKDRQKYYEQVLLRLQEFFLSEDKQETQQ